MEFVVNYCHAMVIGSIIQQERQCTYTRNNDEARSHNHCCRRKAKSIIYFECVCSLGFSSVQRLCACYIAIRDLSGSTIVSHIISSPARFSGGGGLLNIKCVLIFLQFCLKHFLF